MNHFMNGFAEELTKTAFPGLASDALALGIPSIIGYQLGKGKGREAAKEKLERPSWELGSALALALIPGAAGYQIGHRKGYDREKAESHKKTASYEQEIRALTKTAISKKKIIRAAFLRGLKKGRLPAAKQVHRRGNSLMDRGVGKHYDAGVFRRKVWDDEKDRFRKKIVKADFESNSHYVDRRNRFENAFDEKYPFTPMSANKSTEIASRNYDHIQEGLDSGDAARGRILKTLISAGAIGGILGIRKMVFGNDEDS